MKRLHFLYLNYHTIPFISNHIDKVKKYHSSFHFLNYLSSTYKVTVIDHAPKNEAYQLEHVYYKIFKKKRNSKWIFPFKAHLYIIKIKPDIIYVQGLLQMYRLLLLTPFLKKSTIIMVHNHAEKPPSFIKRKILALIDKNVNGYFFSSLENGYDWVDKKVILSKNKIFELTEGSSDFSFKGNTSRVPNSFLLVANLNENKDPLTVIKAFEKYHDKYPKATLTIIYRHGDLLTEVKNHIYKRNLEEQIQLLHDVPHNSMEQQYRQHQFLIQASYYEGGSYALIEGISCGCIPIISDIPTNLSITKNGLIGFSYEVGKPDALFNEMLKTQQSDLNELQAIGQKHFHEHLSYQGIAKKLEQVITKFY